jgi:hypothetical protein
MQYPHCGLSSAGYKCLCFYGFPAAGATEGFFFPALTASFDQITT